MSIAYTPRQTSSVRRTTLATAACLLPMLLAGCAAFPTMTTSSIERPVRADTNSDGPIGGSQSLTGSGTRTVERLSLPGQTGAVQGRIPATDADIAALVPDEPVDATLAPQSIPQFAATVFGSVLRVPYNLTGPVASRGEIIAGGTGGSLSKRSVFRLTQQALKQYGIEVYIENGTVIVGTADQSNMGATLERSRVAPSGAGHIVQFFNVNTILVSELQTLLTDLFPNIGNARITPDGLSNSLIISGNARDVAQVVRVVREIDQPRYAGTDVLRVEPIYWAADALATSVEQALTTEGYITARQPGTGRAITILPFPAANQILIFARDADLLDRASFWVDSLDRPAALGDKASTFVYQARNTDAQSLGQLAMGQSPSSHQPQTPVGVPSDPGGNSNPGVGNRQNRGGGDSSGGGQFMGGRVLTDPIGNRIIFMGTASDYAQLRTLLTTLDTPAPQVVVEVIIAEVTLTDSTSIGVELFGTDLRGDGRLTGSTEGLEVGGGAGLFTFVGADYRARLAANASNDRVNILQRPQLVTRSGGTASFQVGTDVPIITSQAASNNNSGGDTDILQSVQYRQTGTILEVTPLVYGDRVDITVRQELSSAGDAPSGIASPTILNRSLSTQIAIRDGWTGVLGGLISNNYTKVNTGIPFVKDLPVIGSAFQSNRTSGSRTELVLLITPYIVRNDEDMATFAETYSSSMNAAFRTGRGWSYTLTPWSVGARFRGLGFDLPSPTAAHETPSLIPRRGRADTAGSTSNMPGAVAQTTDETDSDEQP